MGFLGRLYESRNGCVKIMQIKCGGFMEMVKKRKRREHGAPWCPMLRKKTGKQKKERKMKDQNELLQSLFNIISQNETTDKSQIKKLIDDIKNFNDIKDYKSLLLTWLLNNLLKEERRIFLENHPDDSGNGFYKRTLFSGNSEIQLDIPRTRHLNFYPTLIPKYSRVLSKEYSNIVESLILSASSIEKLKISLSKLSLPFSESEISNIINNLAQEFKEYINRELESDYLVISIDVKVINVRVNGSVKKAAIYTAIGLDMDANKSIIGSKVFFGNENLEFWKSFLIHLKNRGLARCLLFITDNFKGLVNLIQNLFPQSHHQLCIVHLLRNAKYNLSKKLFKDFRENLMLIQNASSLEEARSILQKTIDLIKSYNKNFADSIQKYMDFYLTFTNYPHEIRKRIKSTNMSENLHKELEKIRLNSGGYFQSEKILYAKWYIFIKNLKSNKWKFPDPLFKGHIHSLHSIFHQTFET